MTDEHRLSDAAPLRNAGSKKGFTRRTWMVVAATGVLAAPAAVALIRWWAKPQAVRLSIGGPFKGYGTLSLKDLKLPEECRAFLQPEQMELSDRPSIDSVFVAFAFKGDEDPSRVLHVECVAVDHQGRPIARVKEVFRDPRIEAKQVIFGGKYTRRPVANISLELPKGVLFSDVRSIDLLVRQDRAESQKSI